MVLAKVLLLDSSDQTIELNLGILGLLGGALPQLRQTIKLYLKVFVGTSFFGAKHEALCAIHVGHDRGLNTHARFIDLGGNFGERVEIRDAQLLALPAHGQLDSARSPHGFIFGQRRAASPTDHRGLGLSQLRHPDVVRARRSNTSHDTRKGAVAGADAHPVPGTVAREFGDDVAQFGCERFDFAVGRNLGLDAFGFVLKFLQRDFFRRNHLLDDFGDI